MCVAAHMHQNQRLICTAWVWGGVMFFFLLPLYVISVQYKLQVHAVLCETLEGFVLRVPIILTYYLLLLFGCSTCC